MEKFRKPKSVTEARLRGDTEALRRMQKKSVESASFNRAVKKETQERTSLEAQLADAKMGTTNEGDVLPPNPDVVNFLEEKLRLREEQ